MPKLAGPVVGISFTEDSIQAVAIRSISSGNGFEVTQVATSPIPKGAFEGAAIADRELLSVVIRDMLDRAKITAKNAVIGLPSRAVFARTVTIPPVPDSERRAVVRGEIDHLSILPPGQGTFDYVLFAKPGSANDSSAATATGAQDAAASAKGGDLALFFAAENHIAQDFWAIGSDIGLNVVGLEPSEYAAVRTMYPSLSSRSLALAVSVGSNNTHLQFLRRGMPVYARRIDVGVQQMTVPDVSVLPNAEFGGWRMPSAVAPEPPVFGGAYGFAGVGQTAEAAPQAPPAAPVDEKANRANAARQRLAQEIGRSIEYFGREYRADLSSLTSVLLPNDLNLAGLPVYITAALEQEVDYANAFEGVQLPPELGDRLRNEEGVAYAPALGLALGQIGGKFAGLPVFNLSLEAVAAKKFKQAPRVLRGAIAASAAVLAAGTAFAVIFAHRDAPVKATLATDRQTLLKLTSEQNAVETALSQQKLLVKQIQSKNLPWTNVLRHLSIAVPSGMGLTMVNAQGTSLTLAGETTSPDWIPAFWSRMNGSNFFTGASVSSITHNDDKIAFQMAATLPAPVVPPDPSAAGTDNTDAIAAGLAATNAAANDAMAARAKQMPGVRPR